MATENQPPEEDDAPPEVPRVYGLLVSEWVTYSFIVAAVVAVFFGMKVGGERDAQAERAMATLDALAEEAERVFESGRALYCDDRLLDSDLLDNDYLSMSIRPAPIDEDDKSLGRGPALYVSVVEDEVSGDTWDTAKRLMALVKKEGTEEAEASQDRPRSVAGDAGDGAQDEDADEPKSRLRKVRKPGFGEDEEYLKYYILATEEARCTQDA